MFSAALEQKINDHFESLVCRLGERKEEILSGLNACGEDVKISVKYLYVTMTVSDIADYDFDIFLDYARHGVYLFQSGNWKEKIPEDIYLNYVLYHRVNEEDIAPCRSYFYGLLANRIQNMDMKQAALEVNYWCAEEAAYRTTDDRTAGPLTVYRSGYGRCGEESTFTVSALRSIGIPARQVYAPRWSHCDDNHAWAEVWCDGSWNFMGACEPEQILNKGWFTNASSRAMMIHSRWFGFENPDEEVTEHCGSVNLLNQLSRYALCDRLKIRVIDSDGSPVSNARVDFEVLNYAELYPAAVLMTDKNGEAEIELGLGSIHLHVSKDGRYADQIVNLKEENQACIVIAVAELSGKWTDFDMIAPLDAAVNYDQPDAQQKILGEQRFLASVKLRERKVQNLYQQENARHIIEESSDGQSCERILKLSGGNFQEIEQFLKEKSIREPGVQQQIFRERQSMKMDLLNALTDKDYRDLKSEVLKEHLDFAAPYSMCYDHGIFVNDLLNPRIQHEPLTAYRKEISEYYTREQKEEFVENPELIWKDIQKNIKDSGEFGYDNLITTPSGCLRLGRGSCLSRRILFTAVCRTLGIPARLRAADGAMEYFRNAGYAVIEQKEENRCGLRLRQGSKDVTWTYQQNWSLAVLQEGIYHTLELSASHWDSDTNSLSLKLETGTYRLLTANRLPNGNLFCKKCEFKLKSGEEQEITLTLREAKLTDMLEQVAIADFELMTESGTKQKASEITGVGKSLLIWLEVGKEPTEHILNELYDNFQGFLSLESRILFILNMKEDQSDPTLKRTLAVLPNVKLYYDPSMGNVNTLGRRMYVDPEKLPLIIVTDPGLMGVYATSGYNVGTGDMLLRILR